jgi:uncharacterized repeat protein (TIGR03837 family)
MNPPTHPTIPATFDCDIFCNVVDNYGDIGVCWRLARQLANEHDLVVRLWVDDLHSLQRLCPEVDVALDGQRCRGVKVRHWVDPFPEVEPTQLVIGAFACELPESYVVAMAMQECKPVWINLEYLSAEDWVDGCHKLPSPHPRLPLVKYFFFPGFTRKTGGLLLERDLLARREGFQCDPQAVAAYWQTLGVPQLQQGELRVSLFGYENPVLPDLLRTWEQGVQLVTCLVPEGRVLPQAAEFFGAQQGKTGDKWQRGNLRVQVLPFVEQERYDELLWACDINFVRGEDSIVRAQWAGKPCIWQIYPQHDGVHMQKLRAFLDKYCAGLPPDAAQAVRNLWEWWNGEPGLQSGWNDFAAHRSMLAQHAQVWAQELFGNNLALNLLDFSREVGRMRPFEIEAGKS